MKEQKIETKGVEVIEEIKENIIVQKEKIKDELEELKDWLFKLEGRREDFKDKLLGWTAVISWIILFIAGIIIILILKY